MKRRLRWIALLAVVPLISSCLSMTGMYVVGGKVAPGGSGAVRFTMAQDPDNQTTDVHFVLLGLVTTGPLSATAASWVGRRAPYPVTWIPEEDLAVALGGDGDCTVDGISFASVYSSAVYTWYGFVTDAPIDSAAPVRGDIAVDVRISAASGAAAANWKTFGVMGIWQDGNANGIAETGDVFRCRGMSLIQTPVRSGRG